MEIVVIPHAELSYERKDISCFKDFDWSKATKADSVGFAQCWGFIETGMSVNEIALIYDLLEKFKPKNIVELGRNYGCSTRIFLQHIIRNGGTLDSWDLKHWPGFIEIMANNDYVFEQNGVPGEYIFKGEATCRLRVAHSVRTPVPEYIDKEGVDFLLIDTEHGITNALPEYCRWREYLHSGSLVAFHDSTLRGPKRAIEIVKEIEEADFSDRIIREYVNERIDGFGVHVLEWKG